MDDAFDVGTRLINLKVQKGFARSFLHTCELFAFHVNQADVLGLKESFRMHGRRAQHFVVANSHGDIAIVGGREPLVVKASANLADVLFDLMGLNHVSFSL